MSEKKFTNYLAYAAGEIVLVVIGILIALQINDGNQIRKDRLNEAMYLIDLKEDFEKNLATSKRTAELIEAILPKLIRLLEQSAMELPQLPVDTLNQDFSLLNSMPAYSSTDRAYNNLIGSGDFKLISSSRLKTGIANYYKALKTFDLVQASHEMDLVTSFQPYILEFLDYQAVEMIRAPDFTLPPPVEKDRILKVLHEREFRNIVTLKLMILTDLLEQNRKIRDINDDLVTLLTALTQE